MTFAALRTVAAGLKGVGAKAIGGRLAAGLKQGAEAGKLGQKIPMMADFADTVGPVNPSLIAQTPGELGQNLAARFGNALTTPPAQSNIMGTAIGVGLGQNPIAALGSNVAGNYAGRVAGNYARGLFGADSVRAGAVENLVNFGVSYKGGELLSGLLAGGEQQQQPTSATEQEAQMRQAQAQVLSQRQMPSNGGMRQMADLQGAAGAYQRPLPPEGRSLQMADRPGMVMADIPPLDAATADKLRKRAIENAQSNIFSATQLGSYMEGM
jgi:hypothetical protein